MQLRKFTYLMFVSMLILAACGGGASEGGGAAAEDVFVVEAATSGSISGMVMFSGTAPEPKLIQMDGEPSCQAEFPDGAYTEEVVVNSNGSLANVFIYVKSGLEGLTFATPSEPIVIDQKGCRYEPHIIGIQVNQSLLIRNSDDVLHNIHPRPVNNREFNIGQPVQGMETVKTFGTAEIMIPVGCDVHSWMSAYVGVVDHPYFAVTGSDGTFEMANLPPGDYVIEAWHEIYGTQTLSVTVGESETVDIELTYTG